MNLTFKFIHFFPISVQCVLAAIVNMSFLFDVQYRRKQQEEEGLQYVAAKHARQDGVISFVPSTWSSRPTQKLDTCPQVLKFSMH